MNMDYYADWCPVCGTGIWFGDGYCSDSCMYVGESWSDKQIALDRSQKDWLARISRIESMYSNLINDEKKEASKMLHEYQISKKQLTDDVLEELIEEGNFSFKVEFPLRYKKWSMEVSVSIDLSALGYNGVEISRYDDWVHIGIYTSRKDLFRLVRDPKKLRAAILAAQNGRDSRHFKWVEDNQE